MNDMSFRQFAYVLSKLENAFRGDAERVDETEVYCFDLAYQSHSARMGDKDSVREFAQHAARSLFDCLALFAENRECTIEVQDVEDKGQWKELGPWLKKSKNSHRYQLRINPKRESKN